MGFCEMCVHEHCHPGSEPCGSCKQIDDKSIPSNFIPTDGSILKQPTIPPMPTVNTPKKETNRPLCIDVMADVFGIEATKHFCLLNAFKCLWGAETEKSKEDVENAVWYLNEYIRLGGEDK